MADRICVCGHFYEYHGKEGYGCFGNQYGPERFLTQACSCYFFSDREQAIDQALGKCVEALDRHERKKRSPLFPFENLFAELDRTLERESIELLAECPQGHQKKVKIPNGANSVSFLCIPCDETYSLSVPKSRRIYGTEDTFDPPQPEPNYRDVTWHDCRPGCHCAFARADAVEKRLAEVKASRVLETLGALAWKQRAEGAESLLAATEKARAAAMRQMALECEAKHKAEAERDELAAWKEGAISVSPPLQEIAEELDLFIGDSIHDKILPGLRALKRSRDEWMTREGQATFKLNEVTKKRDNLAKILNDMET